MWIVSTFLFLLYREIRPIEQKCSGQDAHKLVWKDVLHNKRHEEKSRMSPNVTVYVTVKKMREQ